MFGIFTVMACNRLASFSLWRWVKRSRPTLEGPAIEVR